MEICLRVLGVHSARPLAVCRCRIVSIVLDPEQEVLIDVDSIGDSDDRTGRSREVFIVLLITYGPRQ